jgi:hypothetical protein
MKAFLAGIVTTVIVTLGFIFWHSVHSAEWMIGAIKVPGEAAIRDIQTDMDSKRYDTAKEKIDAFLKTWQRFSSGPDSCSGAGISDIMVTFSKLPGSINATNVEQGTQPTSQRAGQ